MEGRCRSRGGEGGGIDLKVTDFLGVGNIFFAMEREGWRGGEIIYCFGCCRCVLYCITTTSTTRTTHSSHLTTYSPDLTSL